MTEDKPLHICTPLLESVPLSKKAGFKVYIKCDNLQPTASFKIRGIGNMCQKALKKGGNHIISSSGGNAGYAAAYAAKQLGIPATIVIPGSTPEFVADNMRDVKAHVIRHGKVWDHANTYALQLAKEKEGSIVIHPFDHPDIWEGHATVIKEIKDQVPQKPDAVITCVGGGGLLCGVIEGLQSVGWMDVPVIAMETKGADSYNQAVNAGKLVTLPDITSLAKSLGALTVTEKTLEYYKQHPIHSVVLEDKDATQACINFLDDHRMLVELACGAVLAAIYEDVIPKLQKEGKLKDNIESAVVIVCGGASMTLQALLDYKKTVGIE
ncbi:L-serine dehydratase/L-threonine deaminase-like isoform X1 [Amphiura filiformis]|uniref:L-serine dehydratase/L-threonine deaminase-like isoform X1 n=1 Tax=Amphiura filiformis TaxID=82378 RepID=UPI003B2127F5